MSDHSLICWNGSDGEIDDTEDMSLAPVSTTVFTGERASSTFISQKYENNCEFTVRLAKSPCAGKNVKDYFEENELRMMNRLLAGKPGYSWLKVINDSAMETDYYYRAQVTRIEYERLGYKIIGYDVTFTCDGGRAYSEEQSITISARANTPFLIFCNSDDLYDYERPVVTITTSSAGTLTLKNNTDSWTTTVKNMTAGENLTIDSKNEILKSSRTRQYILNDFEGLKWPRLLSGKNEYVCNRNATITFTYRASRKVGFVT
jgi:hypothetical protein